MCFRDTTIGTIFSITFLFTTWKKIQNSQQHFFLVRFFISFKLHIFDYRVVYKNIYNKVNIKNTGIISFIWKTWGDNSMSNTMSCKKFPCTCDMSVFFAVAMTIAAISCSSPPASSCDFAFREESFISWCQKERKEFLNSWSCPCYMKF